MTDTLYPEGWNHESRFPDAIEAAVLEADCGWLQAVTQLGYALAWVLLGCEDEEYRVEVAEILAAKLLDTARTGRISGEIVQ